MKTARRIFALFLALLLLTAVILPVLAASDNGDTIVYRTRTGSKYHRANCSYLKSSYEITLRDAVERGLKPCSRCNPPRFTGTIEKATESPTKSSETSSKNTSSSSKKTTSSITKSFYDSENKTTVTSRNTSSFDFERWSLPIAFGLILLFKIIVWLVVLIKDRLKNRRRKTPFN
jgi:hypothetical protein